MLVGIEKLVDVNYPHNKSRVVSKARGQQMASSMGVPFREVNPKTDDVKYVNEVLI